MYQGALPVAGKIRGADAAVAILENLHLDQIRERFILINAEDYIKPAIEPPLVPLVRCYNGRQHDGATVTDGVFAPT